MKAKPSTRVHRLVILIDADNASPRKIEPLLKEVAKYGSANVKRIYGDWTTTKLSAWKDKLNQFALQPMQQFGYTKGKNSTDSALIIDAMDLLHTRNFDGFCIVSSDSDFTRLASRIREAGLVVYGFGERKTPEAFVKACDKFIYTEILGGLESRHEAGNAAAKAEAQSATEPSEQNEPEQATALESPELAKHDETLLELLKTAYEDVAGEDGWAHLGSMGEQLTKLSPEFDARNYGFKKLGGLIEHTGQYDIKKVPSKKDPGAMSWHVKLRPA